jgi:hypothetical protein
MRPTNERVMKRKNTDLLLKSIEAMFDRQNEQGDGYDLRDGIGNFVWYLSVAREDELAKVYDVVVKDARFWELAVEVHSIFGRVYAASIALSDHRKAVEVSRMLVRPYCDPLEWEDFKDGLALQIEDVK